jgi:glycosyltransferase involved in cell wall biosynthesis
VDLILGSAEIRYFCIKLKHVKYSLIIASYNRIEEIRELLASAEMMIFDRKEFEIVISDDGSKDGTGEFVQQYKSPSGLQLLYIHQENKGPGEARNHGMRSAHGDYFIFIDSDCMFPEDYLQKVDAHLKQHPLDAFGGPDTCHPSFSPLLKAINYSMTSFIGTGGTRGSSKSVSKKFYPRSFNMGIHRKIFDTLGGMGGLRHGQDMEYSSRIYNHGYAVGLIPDAFVYHKRRTSLKRFFKQVFNWGVTRINLGQIDKAMLKPVHFLPLLVVLGVIVVVLGSPALYFLWKTGFLILWIGIGLVAGLIMLTAFLQSLSKYNNLKVSLLSIVTLFIQVFAYGLGMMSGLMQKWTGKKTATGFSKNYYK